MTTLYPLFLWRAISVFKYTHKAEVVFLNIIHGALHEKQNKIYIIFKWKRMVSTHQHWGYQSQKLADGLPAVQTQRAECCLSLSRMQKEQAESHQKTTLSTVIQNLERFAGRSLGLGQMLVTDWHQRLGQQQALGAQSQTEMKTMTLGGQRGMSVWAPSFPPSRMNPEKASGLVAEYSS